jgi:adenylate cyclase class 2
MNIEIEIKAQCHDLSAVKRHLKFLGAKYKGKCHQVDTYYLVTPGGRYRIGPRLRVRQDLLNKKYFWEYHEPLGDYAAEENEIEINDPKTAKYILKKLGYEIDVIIDKVREKYKFGRVNIDLDRVKGLGNFVEVEIMNIGKAEGLKIIRKFLEKLEIPKENFKEYRTYLDLMWEKQGKKVKIQKSKVKS